MNFHWQREGWEPVVLEEVEHVGEWARLKLRRLACPESGFIVRATPWRRDIRPALPTHIKPLDQFGIGRISILSVTEDGPRVITEILVHRVFVACEKRVLMSARRGDAPSISRVAKATFRDWEQRGSELGKLRYPVFVDFRIAKRWVMKAATLGDAGAAKTLRCHSGFVGLDG